MKNRPPPSVKCQSMRTLSLSARDPSSETEAHRRSARRVRVRKAARARGSRVARLRMLCTKFLRAGQITVAPRRALRLILKLLESVRLKLPRVGILRLREDEMRQHVGDEAVLSGSGTAHRHSAGQRPQTAARGAFRDVRRTTRGSAVRLPSHCGIAYRSSRAQTKTSQTSPAMRDSRKSLAMFDLHLLDVTFGHG